MNLRKANLLLKKVPGVSATQALLGSMWHSQSPFLRFAPPGHFYSPVPDLDYIRKHREELFSQDRTSCPGIDLREQQQVELVRELASYIDDMPFSEEKQEGGRYYFNNPYFGRGSGIALYSLMRHFRPQKIVEVGSGFSSAAMLDVNDRFFDGNIVFTFVEPYPERLHSLLTERDKQRHRICVQAAQQVPQSVFTELEPNDILFIDSSHVAKVGSDVVFLFTEILPLLKKGVIVHIHDIYWPFEYPEDWVLAGRAWNEAYVLKAFLQFNDSFRILLFNNYLATHHQDLMKQCLPLGGSSIWLEKNA